MTRSRWQASLIAVLLLGASMAQEDTSSGKRPAFVQVTIGFPSAGKKTMRSDMNAQLNRLAYYGVNNLSTIGYTVTGFGPVTVRTEHAVNSWLALGPVLSVSRATTRLQFSPTPAGSPGLNVITNNYELNTFQVLSLGAGLKTHLYIQRGRNVDAFATIMVGYSRTTVRYSEHYPNNNIIRFPALSNPYFQNGPEFLTDIYHPFMWGISFGVREYLSRRFGLLLEIGCDRWAFLQAGLFLRSH
jgi:hypothetical protein